MSHFLYIHEDLTGEENVWKIGVAMTPYSAVRARQKFCWKRFGLQHLYFGAPAHILFLEQKIKERFYFRSGKNLKGFGTQTEMFQVNITELRDFISRCIADHNLFVKDLELASPYTASNSGNCPYGIPSEKGSWGYLNDQCREVFGKEVENVLNPYSPGSGGSSGFFKKKTLTALSAFDCVFEVSSDA